MSRTDLAKSLRLGAYECQRRGLVASAKWAMEQLMSIPKIERNAAGAGVGADAAAALDPPDEADEIALARSLFQCREFDRAAEAVLDTQSSVGMFLRFYSLFLASENRREDLVTDLQSEQPLSNPDLPKLLQQLQPHCGTDPFLLFLCGVLLRKSGLRKQAVETLLRSVHLFPYHWGAWLELVACCTSVDEIMVDRVPRDVVIATMFHTQALAELNHGDEAGRILDAQLLPLLPDSPYLQALRAFCFYTLQDLPEAERRYTLLFQRHPLRLDHVDVFSNILYVRDRPAILANLAQRVIQIDRYRPETCCVIGNYYSKNSKHEKAVQYFQRALKLHPEFASAWTLMGHEYLELKNVHAAIACYRRAVDINPHDHRAWYSLGQAHELLNAVLYALFYYRKATTLRPFDHRMWRALGVCYERLTRPMDAIFCFERAKDHDVSALLALGRIYRKLGSLSKAVQTYQEYCDRQQGTEPDQTQTEAALFVGQYYAQQRQVDLATRYLTKATELPGADAESAKAELRGLRLSTTSAS